MITSWEFLCLVLYMSLETILQCYLHIRIYASASFETSILSSSQLIFSDLGSTIDFVHLENKEGGENSYQIGDVTIRWL